jgi:hypothetical protein
VYTRKPDEITLWDEEWAKDLRVKRLDSFPPQSNPFYYDSCSMGITLGSNVTVMYSTFPDQHMESLIIVDTFTGKRIKVIFPDCEPDLESIIEKE